MKRSWFSVHALLVSFCTVSSYAQDFQPRRTPTTRSPAQQSTSAISADLLKLYQQTTSAKTELETTAIARACAAIVPNESRSQTDRDYAKSLLAWALNRRGEQRSERVNRLVADNQADEATKLDALAAEDFRTAIEYGPNNWRIHHNYAIALALKSDFRNALKQFDAAIELKSDYGNAYFNRAEIHNELQQFAQALKDYNRAIELEGNDPQYHNSRGHCHFMIEAYEDALADYRKAAELAGNSATYQTDLADAYQYLGRWEEAATAYRAAVAIDGKFARAYQNAAWLMATCPDETVRNQALAISAAKKAIELGAPQDSHALDVLAAATALDGQFEEAVKLARQSIALSEDEQEKAELNQRLQLYVNKTFYVQPEVDRTSLPAASAIRTASGQKAATRQ